MKLLSRAALIGAAGLVASLPVHASASVTVAYPSLVKPSSMRQQLAQRLDNPNAAFFKKSTKKKPEKKKPKK